MKRRCYENKKGTFRYCYGVQKGVAPYVLIFLSSLTSQPASTRETEGVGRRIQTSLAALYVSTNQLRNWPPQSPDSSHRPLTAPPPRAPLGFAGEAVSAPNPSYAEFSLHGGLGLFQSSDSPPTRAST